MKYFLPISNINKINQYMANIKVHLPIIVLYLGRFNALKSVLSMEKSAAGQQIIFNKSMMSQKRSLVTVTLTLRHG